MSHAPLLTFDNATDCRKLDGEQLDHRSGFQRNSIAALLFTWPRQKRSTRRTRSNGGMEHGRGKPDGGSPSRVRHRSPIHPEPSPEGLFGKLWRKSEPGQS